MTVFLSTAKFWVFHQIAVNNNKKLNVFFGIVAVVKEKLSPP